MFMLWKLTNSVRPRPGSSKRPPSPKTDKARKRAKLDETTSVRPVTASDSSSSESESSSSSDSSSDSTSDSSSDTDSDSDAEPQPRPTREPVPPGEGLGRTHERNQRRKKARKARAEAKRLEAAGVAPVPASRPLSNLERLAAAAREAAALVGVGASIPPLAPELALEGKTVPKVQELPVPRDMANRNKKKGFLREMLGVQGTKTVFEDAVSAASAVSNTATAGEATPADAYSASSSSSSSESSESASDSSSESESSSDSESSSESESESEPEATPAKAKTLAELPFHASRPPAATLAPYSERSPRSLPCNVFVTSRQFDFIPDSERRIRDAKMAKAAEKKRARQESEVVLDYGEPLPPSFGGEGTPTPVARTPVKAPAKAAETAGTAGTAGMAVKPAEMEAVEVQVNGDGDELPESAWTSIEDKFDTLASAQNASVGQLVAWKSLELDMTTFSPEIKLLLARVTERSDSEITLERLRRPDEWVDEEEGEDEIEVVVETLSPGELGERKLVV